MISNHSPILLKISENVIQKGTTVYISKLTVWHSYKAQLKETLNLSVSLRKQDQLESDTEIFIKDIQPSA